MIENIFDTSVNAQSQFPNYTLSRKSVVYKPTTDVNLTTLKDDNVVSSSNPAHYKLSLQNRSNTSNSPIAPQIPQSKRAYILNGNKIFTRALIPSSAIPQLIDGINKENSKSNVYEIQKTINNSTYGKDGQEIFDISIIRLDDLNGNLIEPIKRSNANFELNNLITINSSNSNTEANSKTVFNDLISSKKIFNSTFNLVNVTPQNNFFEFGINPKNIIASVSYTQQPVVYSKYGPEISSSYGLNNFGSLYYPSVPVFEQIGQLEITLTFAEKPRQSRTLIITCFDGEDVITSAQVNTNQIVQGVDNVLKITLNNLKPKNYYTYTNAYSAGTSLRTSNGLKFWKFNNPQNLAYAHLSTKKQLGFLPKYNFHIQTFELSILITY